MSWVWKKAASAKWEDAWEERLRFLGPRVAIFAVPGSRMLRMEAYVASRREAESLVRSFGGKASPLKRERALRGRESFPKSGVAIRGRLRIFDEVPPGEASGKGVSLVIPAGLAFGTGSHATTASCLRLACDLEKVLPPDWTCADLGCGSGILAIAAEKLGAAKVVGIDYDPVAIKTAKANAKLNGCKRAGFKVAGVEEWRDAQAFDLIFANLFSEILVRNAGRISAQLKPRGAVIASGLLGSQESEVAEAFRVVGLRVGSAIRSGKWSALVFKPVKLAS